MVKSQIVIIGAGFAGLAAANELRQHGVEATILEARNVIGGRIKTDHSLGFPLDIGASWLHGIDGNPLAALANQLKLKFVETNFSNMYFMNNQMQQVSPEIVSQYRTNKFESLLEAAKQYAYQQKNDIPLSEALSRAGATSSELLTWSEHIIGLYTGSEAQCLSARHWDDEEILTGGHHLIIDGYDQIIAHLAKDLQVELNTTVNAINYQNNKVELQTNNKSFIADKVIITVPLSLLKNNNITFTPNLPETQQQAIQHLGMGLLNRYFLLFPNQFWPNDYFGFYLPRIKSGKICHFLNYGHYINMPIIMGALSGKEAKEYEQKSDAEMINEMMETFRYYFGEHIPNPDKAIITRWNQEPFSHGAYSYIPVGASDDDYDQLAKPVQNKLFFAGEATYGKYMATTHGAYLSGIRAARECMS